MPRESEEWNDDSCSEAFEALASLPSQEYFRLFSISIDFIDFTPEEFFGWITKRRFDKPKFWRRDTDFEVADENRRDGGTPNFHSGRGTKKRAIQTAFKSCFPSGVIPPGMTSETRNDLIFDELKKMGLRSLPNKRTIERAIDDL